MPPKDEDALDIAQQALAAKEHGINEVVRLLQHPEDLSRLPDIRLEFENRARVAKTSLSSMVQSQVEATRLGMELLDRSHRHILKLQAALDQIDKLCAECSDLIQHHDKIKLLSLTHGNVKKVLTEIQDIIELPDHADRCWRDVEEDDANLVPAFEKLVVLTGTCENAKQAWQRNYKSKPEVSALATFLQPVEEVMAQFEERLFLYMDDFLVLAEENPALLVSCVRVVELQELLDAQYARVKMDYKPKRYKDRFFLNIHNSAYERFQELMKHVELCNVPMKKVMHDKAGNLVQRVERDFQGGIKRLIRVVKGEQDLVDDPEVLRRIEVIETVVFDEGHYLEQLLDKLVDLESDLINANDLAQDCFPPHYDLYNRLFQTYHVQFAEVLDVLGHKATQISTQGGLRILEWLQKYMENLRNLAVEESLIKLPPAPSADPEAKPGMMALMKSFVERMESTLTQWYKNSLADDLQRGPEVMPNGTLFTSGAILFFQSINQQVEILEAMDEHGEVMLQTAQCALRLMQGFQKAQKDALAAPAITLEMCVAFVNNNIICSDTSLKFAKDVKKLLRTELRDALDIETVCRGFLDVAKAACKRAVEVMYNDPGMKEQIKSMYTSSNVYLSGGTTRTLIGTLKDYFRNDFQKWVHKDWVKRVADAALEQLVRLLISQFCAAPPKGTEAIERMEDDVDELRQYFHTFIQPDLLQKHIDQLSGMHKLMVAPSTEEFVLAYTSLVSYSMAFTLEAVQKIITTCRTDLQKKQVQDITTQCRELWKQRQAVAAKETSEEQGRGFFGWGAKKATPA